MWQYNKTKVMEKVGFRLGEKTVMGRLMLMMKARGVGDCVHYLAFYFKGRPVGG